MTIIPRFLAAGTTSRRDRGPLPPRGVRAGHGVDLGGRRRLRRRPTGGVDLLKQLRGQDEPFWTALAGYTVGFVETTVGRYDDALAHLTEMRELAERFGNAWLIAASRVALGTPAVVQARSQEARALLDEGWTLAWRPTAPIA